MIQICCDVGSRLKELCTLTSLEAFAAIVDLSGHLLVDLIRVFPRLRIYTGLCDNAIHAL